MDVSKNFRYWPFKTDVNPFKQTLCQLFCGLNRGSNHLNTGEFRVSQAQNRRVCRSMGGISPLWLPVIAAWQTFAALSRPKKTHR